MSLLGNSYQFDTAIIWFQQGPWFIIADNYGSFLPVSTARFASVIIQGFYRPLVEQGKMPESEHTMNYAVRLYCKEFYYQYVCLN